MRRVRAEDKDAVQFLLRQHAQEADVDGVVGVDAQHDAADLADAGVGNIEIELVRQVIFRYQGQHCLGLRNADDIAAARRHVHHSLFSIFDACGIHCIFHAKPAFAVIHERFFLAQVMVPDHTGTALHAQTPCSINGARLGHSL
ncbi:hypothetical protein AT6N2_C1918 [Agrobacterium tumefaciens]|nr:hypothetical protein AT6N2_C1918 [Agrobacterium tumefaciens]